MVKGMRGFVQHTLSLKFDSQRLQLQQQMAFDERGEALPSIKLMQENVRLIVLTTEVRVLPSSSCGFRISPLLVIELSRQHIRSELKYQITLF